MNPRLSPSDAESVANLAEIRQINNVTAQVLYDFLNEMPRAITPELMRDANPDGTLSVETVFRAILAELCGLTDRKVMNDYLRPGVKRLNAAEYRANAFYKEIQIPETKFGRWELQHETYEPFELFVRDDLWIQNDFREIPRVGFFEEAFRFPVVKEAGREWMAVKPSEIETMKPAISEVSGRVAALGLGLGYFPFMAARKLEVDRVVVVERDAESIALFEKFILPQFQDPKKIEIVESDAFEFLARTHSAHGFDFVFVDLWHDAFDGLKLYLRTKEFEYKNDSVRFLYWVESSLISAFRWRKFHDVVEKAATFEEVLKELKYDSERCRS